MLRPKKCLIGKLNQVIQKVYPQLQSKTATPSEEVQVIEADRGVYGLKKVTINEIPSEYVIPTGSVNITSNGNHNVSGKETANVNVQPVTQSKTITPTKQTQNVVPDQNYDGLNEVIVNPIPDDYIIPSGTKNITTNGTQDVTNYANVNVNVQASTETKTVKSTTTTQTINPTSGKLINQITVQPIVLDTVTVTPTTSSQTITPTNDGLGQVNVNPIPSEYIIPSGSQSITENGTYDVTNKASASVNVQPSLETKSVTITNNGTTTVNKSSDKDGMTSVEVTTNVQPNLQSKSVTIVENKTTNISADSGYDGLSSVSVTTNVPGIIPTGTISITENGVVDVTNYASADIDVQGGTQFTISTGTSAQEGGYLALLDQVPSAIVSGTSLEYAFASYKGNNIPRLIGTENVIIMDSMFQYAKNISSLDVSYFDTSNVERMSQMFRGDGTAINFYSLDLSSFNTSKVYNMYYMFSSLPQLARLDISNFDFSAVTNNKRIFSSCGTSASVDNGAYAQGIPYIFVKDTTAQNWILALSSADRPSTWTTANVVVAGGPDDPRT